MNPRQITTAPCNIRSVQGLSVHTSRRQLPTCIWWQALGLCLLGTASGIVAILIISRL